MKQSLLSRRIEYRIIIRWSKDEQKQLNKDQRKEGILQNQSTKKLAGTSLFVLLLAAALFTSLAFAQAQFNPNSENNGNGNKYGHIYGVGNGGTPPGPNK